MRLNGYIQHIDLGIDPESGERNVLVHSAEEFFRLPEEEQCRAWAVVKVAGEILEKPAITIYQQAYAGKIASKVVKKNAFDRRGLTLVKVENPLKNRATRRAVDNGRIVKGLKRSLKRASWIPSNQKLLIEVMVDTRLRNMEREMFGSEAKTNKGEQGNEQSYN